MDLNLFASQIPTSSSAQDTALSQPPSGKTFSPSHTRKSFSSVLRTLHHEEDGPQPQKPKGSHATSSDTSSEARETQLQGKDRQSTPSQGSQLPPCDASADRAHDGSCSSSTGSTQSDHDVLQDIPMDQSEIPHDGVSQGMLLALLHAPAPDQTPLQQVTAEPTPTDGVSALSAESGQRAQDLVTPMIVQVPTVDDPAPTLPSNVLHPTAEESSVLSGEQSARLTGDPRLPVNRQAPSPDEPRQEQIQPTQGPNIPVSQAGDKETPVVVPEHDAQRQPGTVTANGLSQSHRQTMEADNAARLVRQVTGADVQNVRDRQPAPPKQEIAVPKESVEEEERGTSGTVLPHGWKEFSDGDFGSDLLFSQKDDGPHGRDERLLSQSTMPLDSPANHSAVAAAFAAGHSDQTTPRPVNSNATPMTPGQPVTAPHDGKEPVISLPSRSVVFEVAQPDLGRIHVRVAMTNDLVHTHLSSDRSDVGQFLMNGQDRLQAALQASGFDMGQFRVDIDRQSAGRSFQQGPPQEQGRGWHQNQARSEHNHGPDSHDGKHSASRGMLNLVA